MTHIPDIVQKLWNLCNDLRDDGVSYHQYMIELTFLLFLKMAKERGQQHQLPEGYLWDDLKSHEVSSRLAFYKKMLSSFAEHEQPLVKMIFSDSTTAIRKPSTLNNLINEIDSFDWYNAKKEGFGDLYEGLLAKNAGEIKSGAGQYFTSRSLIDSIISVIQPKSSDIIQDPAAGTGGFVIAAHQYITKNEGYESWSDSDKKKYLENTFHGMEIVPETHRLALMNMSLHGLSANPEKSGIYLGDTLGEDYSRLGRATLVLSNPPFGTKKGGGKSVRKDLPYPSSNKQLSFLQHIYLSLKPNGRAAVVVPDNVLSDGGAAKLVREDLMNKCNLHTILRLPTGIFYAHNVNTSVLFLSRGRKRENNTKEVWIYDLRDNSPQFGKRTPLERSYFAGFERAFGNDPSGGEFSLKQREKSNQDDRFRRFTLGQIQARNGALDFTWTKDMPLPSKSNSPTETVSHIIDQLQLAIGSLNTMLSELHDD